MFCINTQFNLLLGSVLVISSCKYDIYTNRNNIYKSNNYPMVQICSYDPYGYITVVIKEKLRMNNISYTDCQKNFKFKKTPCILLYIIHTSERFVKTALFDNGAPAEYQLIFSLTVKIRNQDNEFSLFNIKTSKSFFDNPLAISSDSVKKFNIRKIIYEEASNELLNQLFLYQKNN